MNDDGTDSTSGTRETATGDFPTIPGGWCREPFTFGQQAVTLTRPANPDAFLDAPEVLAEHPGEDDSPYWPYLWPAARWMAQRLPDLLWPAGGTALEVGAGIGLVGLSALTCGLQVTFSDYAPDAVATGVRNAHQNGYPSARGIVFDWNTPTDLGRFDIILGCDILYQQTHHRPLLELCQRALAPGGRVVFGDGGRIESQPFIPRARGAGWTVELRDDHLTPLSSPHIGRPQLLILHRPHS